MGPDMKLVKALVHRDRLKLVTRNTSTDGWWYKPNKRQRDESEGEMEPDSSSDTAP